MTIPNHMLSTYIKMNKRMECKIKYSIGTIGIMVASDIEVYTSRSMNQNWEKDHVGPNIDFYNQPTWVLYVSSTQGDVHCKLHGNIAAYLSPITQSHFSMRSS